MKRVRVYDALVSLPESYKNLFGINHQESSFFLSYEWFENLIQNSLNIDHSMRFFGLEDASDGTASALASMCVSSSAQHWYTSRKLIAASNYYTSFFRLIQDDRDAKSHDNIRCLIRGIVEDAPQWDCIDMHPMAGDSIQFTSIQRAFKDAGALTQTYFCFGNWYLKLEGRNSQEYFTSLPSRLRNTIDRKTRQLEKSRGLRIELVQTEAQLHTAVSAYEQVYNSSWKQSEAHPHFISGLMQVCAQQGWLRLGIAYVDNQAVAAQLWIVHQKIASIYKLAYDENYSKFSIGSILTAHMMRHVIDIDLVSEVDYLTGDDDYKKDWMSHRRERWGIIAFNQATLKGKLAGYWHLGRQELKRLLINLKFLFKKFSKRS